jgi:hypothetical protein
MGTVTIMRCLYSQVAPQTIELLVMIEGDAKLD